MAALKTRSDSPQTHDIHMDTAKGITMGLRDIHMGTAKSSGGTWSDDIAMDTARNMTTMKGSGFQLWERELLQSAEVKRKATVAQLCEHSFHFSAISSSKLLPVFLDYYFMNLGYIASRKERRARFDADTNRRQLTSAEYAKEFKSYCGRERVILRKRRAKLRVDQFHIIAQVGQGGYGEVFLARKQDTGEICALKKMKKRTLFKMDEVCCPLETWYND